VTRTLRRITLLLVLLAALVAIASPALGAGEAIKGRLIAVSPEGRDPVPGVSMIVSQDGSEIGSGVSDEDGNWVVAVPTAGVYQVALDQGTLPDGVALTDPEASELPNVVVKEGQPTTVIFRLGPGANSAVSNFGRVGSLIILGLKLGAIIALCAIGLSLVFAVTGLVNFAHGELVTLGAVLAFYFHGTPAGPQWPLAVAAVPAVALGGLFGWVQDKAIWKPLRDRRVSALAMMVVSIGLAFALRNLILIVFDGLPRAYPDWAGQPAVNVLGVQIVPKHLFAIAVALVVLVGVGLFLQKTRAGTALRAVSDNKDLAESSGIDVNKIIAITWVLSGTLAALGGIIFALTETVQWDMGFKLLLIIFAAVVLGGLGTAYGAIVGAFIVGLTVELSTLVFPNELKAGVGLLLLIVMLLVRPQGILGSKDRVG
jgi:branched-chain amino acid transport system permease protein